MKAKIYRVDGRWFARLRYPNGYTVLGPGRSCPSMAYEALRAQTALGILSVMPPAGARSAPLERGRDEEIQE